MLALRRAGPAAADRDGAATIVQLATDGEAEAADALAQRLGRYVGEAEAQRMASGAIGVEGMAGHERHAQLQRLAEEIVDVYAFWQLDPHEETTLGPRRSRLHGEMLLD